MDYKFRPRTIEELETDPTPVTLLNEPLPPDNVSTIVRANQRSLHAVLCEALTNTKGLLQVRHQYRRIGGSRALVCCL
jgi:hypothetical protein